MPLALIDDGWGPEVMSPLVWENPALTDALAAALDVTSETLYTTSGWAALYYEHWVWQPIDSGPARWPALKQLISANREAIRKALAVPSQLR